MYEVGQIVVKVEMDGVNISNTQCCAAVVVTGGNAQSKPVTGESKISSGGGKNIDNTAAQGKQWEVSVMQNDEGNCK